MSSRPAALHGPTSPEADIATLLHAGGDSRTRRTITSDLDAYGCASIPDRRIVPLGSCTASTISDRAWDAAAQALSRAIWEPEELAEELKSRIAAWFGLNEHDRVLLCPSGTDAMLAAVGILRTRWHSPWRTIGVSPDELGRGVPHALAGRHFTPQTPLSGPTEVGALVGVLPDATGMTVVSLRDEGGNARALDDVDLDIRREVEDAIARGEKVLLQTVLHSKTGLTAPSESLREELRHRYGDRIVCLVDAAQGRVSASRIRRALGRGDLVVWTGSKFWGGPAFSGALLVPDSWSRSVQSAGLESGLEGYLSRVDLPRSWKSARSGLVFRANRGLLLRWSAALAEVDALSRVPKKAQQELFAVTAALLEDSLSDQPCLQVIDSPPVYSDAENSLERFRTVFSFEVSSSRTGVALPRPALQRLWSELRHPMDGHSFQLGQPVSLSPDRAVLRIAIGAPLLNDVVSGECTLVELKHLLARFHTRLADHAGRVS